MQYKQHYDLLSKDVVSLILSPVAFLLNILMQIPKEFDNEVKTAALTGTTVKLNPDYYMSQPKEVRTYILFKLAAHIAFLHPVLGAGLLKERWETACEYWTNNFLLKEYGLTIPEGFLYTQEFNGLTVIEIYKLLQNKEENEEENTGSGSTDFPMKGMFSEDSSDAQESKKAVEQAMNNIVQQAAIQTKQAGQRIPAQTQEFLDQKYAPQLPWNSILEKYMNSKSKDDFSWSKPNRKYLMDDIYLPSMYSEAMGEIVIYGDSSGSVSDEDFSLYINSVKQIVSKLNPTKITFKLFTTDIEQEYEITSETDLSRIETRGYGGTCLHCVFEDAAKIKPEVIIIFSDMECTPWTQKTNFDVINIVVNNTNYSGIGKSIYVKTN